MRTPRKICESNTYHITSRGTGRQIIFEDEDDKYFFTRCLEKACLSNGCSLLAWCLMSNHFHLVLRADMPQLSTAMRTCLTSYALYFNKRHDRVGHVFQDRFGSVPIETDEQLLQAIRYVHLNPRDAGADYRDYPWSSFCCYMGKASMLEAVFDGSTALELLGGREGLRAFHHEAAEGPANGACISRAHVSDGEATRIAQELLGSVALGDVKGLPKQERNELLGKLCDAGLSIRQIERLTGIGRGVVQRASKM